MHSLHHLWSQAVVEIIHFFRFNSYTLDLRESFGPGCLPILVAFNRDSEGRRLGNGKIDTLGRHPDAGQANSLLLL
jgi:hypothetical protein